MELRNFARDGLMVVLLLCGGDKSTQDKDIKRAKDCFHDYKRRTAAQTPRSA
jgi:putative addiction module killer protein